MDWQELIAALRQARRDKGVSQSQMAAHLGLSRATLSAFENGRAGDIGVRKIMAIADYLGLSLALRPKSPFPTFEELLREH